MNVVYKHTIRFVIFAFLQAMVFNQLNIGFGIHLMIQPLYIMLLPFELTVIPMMGIAFLMGLVIDIISNTYGLNTSSLVLWLIYDLLCLSFMGQEKVMTHLKSPPLKIWALVGLLWFMASFSDSTLFGSFYSKFLNLAESDLSCKKRFLAACCPSF